MRLNWLLVFIPIGIGLDWCGANPLLVFLASALAVVPLAGLMGDATEVLARFLGPAVGGLLNATLGNAPEIIISGFALRAGLVDMVKSSLTGSILGNLLFGLGVSFFLGGLKFGRVQRFDPDAARMTSALLTTASIGLIIPAMTQYSASATRSISRESAVVLFVVYLASLVAIFWNRKPLIGKEGVKATLQEKKERPDEVQEEAESGWSRNQALVVLAVVTTALAIMSEVLTGSIEPASERLHLSPTYRRLLAGPGWQRGRVVKRGSIRPQGPDGPVHRHHRGRRRPGRLGRRGSVLVFMGMLMGQDMNLIFSPLELIAIVMAIYLTRNLIYDGESSWLEGLIMIGVYFLFGIGFLHHPGTDPPNTLLAPPAAGARP